MIGIIDYGAGNLFSVQNALEYLGAAHRLLRAPEELTSADGLILPGVGAFPDAMAMLDARGFSGALRREAAAGKPLLGICLGMQLLFETGFEFAETPGLGLIPGTVRRIDGGGLKIPHMGWNDLTVLHPCALSDGVRTGDYVYFVHSYRAETDARYISCYTMYHERIPALVFHGNVYGAQFHPEKSGRVGMGILQNFVRVVTGA